MLHLGTMIPQLKSRQGGARSGGEVQPQQSSSGGATKKGKGGKRR